MTYEFNYKCSDEAETIAFGKKLARIAQKGDVFLLNGTLGMGKTTLSRAFIQELTKAVEVPSPTFTLVQTYEAEKFEIYHFDLYRLKSEEEIFEIGMEEAMYDGVSLIEWPEKMGGYLPKKAFILKITPDEISGRNIQILVNEEDKKQRRDKL